MRNEGSPLVRCGQLELDGTVQTLDAMPCIGIWIQHDSGNSNPIYVGDKYRQYMSLPIANTAGYFIRVSNSDVVCFKGTNGEKMNYLIER